MKKKIKECRGCGATTLFSLIDLLDMPIGGNFSCSPNSDRNYPIGLVVCARCSLVQLKHEVCTYLIFGTQINRGFTDLQRYLGEEDFSSPKTPYILEVGGPLSMNVKKSPLDSCLTVSLDRFLMQTLEEPLRSSEGLHTKFTLDSVKEFIDRYGKTQEIRITNEIPGIHPLHLNNVANTQDYLERLLLILDEGGRVVVRFPSVNKIVEGALVGYIYHEHQSYFDQTSLSYVMGSVGLKLVQRRDALDQLNEQMIFERVDPNGMSKSREFSDDALIKKNVADRVSQFNSLGVKLSHARKVLKRSLNKHIQMTRVGYGASVAAIAAMYQLEIDKTLDFLVDDDERKAGLYSPRANLEVRSSQRLNSVNVGCTVILIPRFERQILASKRRSLGTIWTTDLNVLWRQAC